MDLQCSPFVVSPRPGWLPQGLGETRVGRFKTGPCASAKRYRVLRPKRVSRRTQKATSRGPLPYPNSVPLTVAHQGYVHVKIVRRLQQKVHISWGKRFGRTTGSNDGCDLRRGSNTRIGLRRLDRV